MLDLRFVADNIDLVKQKLALRNSNADIEEIARLSLLRRQTIQNVEALKAERNQVSAQIAVMKRQKQDASELIFQMRQKGDKIKELDALLAETEEKLKQLMYTLPNLVDDSVPYGKSGDDNVEVEGILNLRSLILSPRRIGTSGKAWAF